MIAQLALIVRKVKAGFASLLAFELRATDAFPLCASLKEGGEGFAQIQKWLIGGVFRDLPGEGESVPAGSR